MSGRPRTSTLVISGLFLAVLALYFLVRPVTPPASATGTATPGITAPCESATELDHRHIETQKAWPEFRPGFFFLKLRNQTDRRRPDKSYL